MNLHDSIAKLLAYDEEQVDCFFAEYEREHKPPDDEKEINTKADWAYWGMGHGVERENARLKPVLMALLNCVDALEKVSANKTQCVYSQDEKFREGSHIAFGQSAELADEALAALRNLSDKGDGK